MDQSPLVTVALGELRNLLNNLVPILVVIGRPGEMPDRMPVLTSRFRGGNGIGLLMIFARSGSRPRLPNQVAGSPQYGSVTVERTCFSAVVSRAVDEVVVGRDGDVDDGVSRGIPYQWS